MSSATAGAHSAACGTRWHFKVAADHVAVMAVIVGMVAAVVVAITAAAAATAISKKSAQAARWPLCASKVRVQS